MAQEDCIVGFTSAPNALLATVLQSNEFTPPPEPLLLQDRLMKTNKINIDSNAETLLMVYFFREELIP
jgi:hypothetical protein